MAIDQELALAVLRRYPTKWNRPTTNARLLSYLLLALRGEAIAVRDNEGYMFQLVRGRVQPEPAVMEKACPVPIACGAL